MPAFCALTAAGAVQAATLPGLAELSGTVTAAPALGQLTVYALNTDRSVGYMVYVVDGSYRAVDLFPGHYKVSVRGTSGQLNMDLKPTSTPMILKAGQRATRNLKFLQTTVPATYVGGMPYPHAKIAAYDQIYPRGHARDVMEKVCFGCHTSQLYPYNVVRDYPGGRPAHDRDGWAITIDRMAHGTAFNSPGKPSNFDPKLMTKKEEDELADYLAANFGPDSAPRVVKQVSQPPLDKAVLMKAEFIEYRFRNKPGENRFTHTLDFDPTNGHVFAMDRGEASIVDVDPTTGARKDHIGQGGGEYLQVDVDGTVWYGGLGHLDPKTGLFDTYRIEGSKFIGVSTMAIDSQGDIWLSLLGSGGLAKYDRKTDRVLWWDVPILRSRPYGLSVDRNDKVWFAEYHNSGIGSFDPKTQTFRNYPITKDEPTNIRRTNADSHNFMWAATWGHPNIKEGGSLFRIDPATGESVEHKVGIAFANPYDSDVDEQDNVWVATDNHIMKFDPKTSGFTYYPTPERTDVPKLSLTREGAIWFSPRNAGQSGGYGGCACVLYPDKDQIKTLAAYYSDDSERNHRARYKGPTVKVTGATKVSPAAEQNPGEYTAMLAKVGLAPVTATTGATKVIKGGAAPE